MSNSRRARPSHRIAPAPAVPDAAPPGTAGTTQRPAGPDGGLTFAQVRARIQRPRRFLDMVLDAEAAAEIDHLTEQLELARARDELDGDEPPTAPDLARLLQAAELRADSSRVTFELQAIPWTAYKALQDDHPATAERLAEIEAVTGEKWGFDPDELAPLLVHAQLISPAPASEEDFEEFWGQLSDGQMRRFWLAALGLQLQVTQIGPRSQLAAEVLKDATG